MRFPIALVIMWHAKERWQQEQAHLEAGLVRCEVLGQDVLLLYIMVACKSRHRVIISSMTEKRYNHAIILRSFRFVNQCTRTTVPQDTLLACSAHARPCL